LLATSVASNNRKFNPSMDKVRSRDINLFIMGFAVKV
jgi:hypothetical protein